jgi:PEP-CTERM motif
MRSSVREDLILARNILDMNVPSRTMLSVEALSPCRPTPTLRNLPVGRFCSSFRGKSSMRSQNRLLCAVAVTAALLSLTAGNARADIVFGFEDQMATSGIGGSPGTYTFLSETVGGLTLSLTRPGSTFDIFDTTTAPGDFPAAWGNRTLDPFSDFSTATPFVANFSSPISSFAMSYGDFDGDSDTGTIMAYSGLNGTGTLLGSASDVYGDQSLPDQFDTFGVAADGIQSVVFIGGSSAFPNSVYYDNLDVTVGATVAPEPASLTLLGIGIAGLGLRSWRKRTAA